MSCFFGCFRVKDSGANLVTPSEPVAPRSKNALSSLFHCDDESLRKAEECQNRLPGEVDVREFSDENEFPKGVSLETPVRIRKTLEKWEDVSAQNVTQKSLKFDSRLPNSIMEKPELEKQYNESSILVGSCSSVDTPRSCMTDGYYTGGVSSSSVQISDIHIANEPTRFHPASERSGISSISSEQSGSAGASSVIKPLPYPNMEELGEEELGDGDFAFSHHGDSNEQKDKDDLKPIPELDLSVKEETDDDESLTSWFKPISAMQDGNKKQVSSISSQNRKPPADRPILGMVAAHWNDEEKPKDPPKWWDGNGIPNSTNKYKEDQKVSWHATPFEERLEKALSQETLVSHRKPNNSTTPFEFEETEESDTAMSHFQSSPQLKSVVSF